MERKIFISNVKNFHTQQKLLTETLLPFVALIAALIDEKRITNYIKMTNSFKSNGFSVQNFFIYFLSKEKQGNIEHKIKFVKRGCTFSLNVAGSTSSTPTKKINL